MTETMDFDKVFPTPLLSIDVKSPQLLKSEIKPNVYTPPPGLLEPIVAPVVATQPKALLPLSSNNYVPASMFLPKSATTTANGYLTHASAMLPVSIFFLFFCKTFIE